MNKTKKKGDDSVSYATDLPMKTPYSKVNRAKTESEKDIFYISNETRDGKEI
jgi:Ulp1 family protease